MGVGLAFSWDFLAFISGNWDQVWGRGFFLGAMAAGAVGGAVVGAHTYGLDRRTLYKQPKSKAPAVAIRLRWN